MKQSIIAFSLLLLPLVVAAQTQPTSSSGPITALDIGEYCTKFVVGGTVWVAAQGMSFHDDFMKVLAAHYARGDSVFVASPLSPGYEGTYPPSATCTGGPFPNAVFIGN